MHARELPWGKIAAALVAVTLVAALIVIVGGGQAVPDSVQPIDWNHQPCAHCQMLIGNPRYAAQLVTEDGEVLSFDDPGCALRYIDAHHPRVHALWFHHSVEDRWIAAPDARFVTGAMTPMGSGLAAVDRGVPGAVDAATATRRAIHPESAPEPGR